MSAKTVRLRRRSKPGLGARVRTYWVLGALLLFLAAYALWLAVNSSYFAIKTVSVMGATARVTKEDVLRFAAIPAHQNALLLDVRGIERRVERIPYVASARVHRALPAGVRIEITERAPDGCLRGQGFAVTIDRSARVLSDDCDPALVVYRPRGVDEAPVGSFVHASSLARLQRAAHVLGAGGERLTDFSEDRYGQLSARLGDGIEVDFGSDEDLEGKRRLIGPILASLGDRVVGVKAIDLRAPSAPVVRR